MTGGCSNDLLVTSLAFCYLLIVFVSQVCHVFTVVAVAVVVVVVVIA